MLQNIKNLRGTKTLSKNEQKSVKGGDTPPWLTDIVNECLENNPYIDQRCCVNPRQLFCIEF
ncbi:hypothetical protein [uncultured Aquimarina sp.]|uniref:hypothetical protein n=1 Tax=uncultured Aquimarina sp. TaxID=575652 RepID=UPI00261B54C3|nr:hypothetical protein [uncultured Aquimarina sp.]